MFPIVDPIPLPAPVWLMKLLHLVTLSLHFVAVQLLVGGLVVASLWAIWGRMQRHQPMLDAAGAVSYRLPIVMTYVINLGVPPLLFSQVLYGRQIYSSSVLIGTYWIAVIGLLMVGYTLLYIMSAWSKGGNRPWGWIGLVALAFMVGVGYIYTNNMTLMVRPEVWTEMYRQDPLGRQLNAGDATVLPRWLFLMVGSLASAGVGMTFLGMKKFLAPEAAMFLRRWGSALMIVGVVAAAGLGYWTLSVQPAGLMDEMAKHGVYTGAMYAWLGTAALIAVVGAVGFARAGRGGWLLPSVAGALAVVNMGAMVLYRDGLRDVALMTQGFDVWDRAVHSNWIVVAAFLLLFVAGLATVGWLSWVVSQMKGEKEEYA